MHVERIVQQVTRIQTCLEPMQFFALEQRLGLSTQHVDLLVSFCEHHHQYRYARVREARTLNPLFNGNQNTLQLSRRRLN